MRRQPATGHIPGLWPAAGRPAAAALVPGRWPRQPPWHGRPKAPGCLNHRPVTRYRPRRNLAIGRPTGTLWSA